MAKNEHKSAKVKDVPMEGSGEESEEETLGMVFWKSLNLIDHEQIFHNAQMPHGLSCQSFS